ncbi:MAG: glycosyltransferase family 2 protein [Ruthenibacterium sp.]
MDRISLVVPCYNEQEALGLFYAAAKQVTDAMEGVETEFIFVDDGSTDATLAGMRALARQDARVRYLSFSRNFGKEAAMLAGLSAAKGDFVAVMDADMQDPPALLPEMYAAVKTGEYDCAATRRVTRKGEPPVRSFFARLFYRLINKISKTEIVDGARDFRLMTRQMVDAVLSMKEYNRFSKGIFGWVGFRTKWLEYVNVERIAGETKWSFWKLFAYSIDGITAFSTVPLTIAAFAGFLFCAAAFLMLLFVFIRAAIWGDPVSGWPSMVCIILLVGGIQLFCVGILGEYLAKMYMEVKHRPQYIIKEENKEIL